MNYLNSHQLKNSYVDLPKNFYTRLNPTPVNDPKLIVFNRKLADSLGINLPELLATTSLGHIIGAGAILGLGYLGVLA